MSKCKHYWDSKMVDPSYPDCLICKVDELEAERMERADTNALHEMISRQQTKIDNQEYRLKLLEKEHAARQASKKEQRRNAGSGSDA